MNDSDVNTLQIDLGRQGEWAVQNAMEINPGNIKAVIFTVARVKDPLNYIFGGAKEFRKRATANAYE